jgi:NAD(P)H-hydrate epimerase
MTAALVGSEEDEALVEGKRAVAVGPGLDPGDGTRALLARLLDAAVARGARVVLDADGLNHVAREPALLDGVGDRVGLVLTPHPGEAARLLGSSTAEVQGDRVAAALELARRFKAVVALKGARTVIAASDGALAFCPTGGPVLGVGGTGDVLTGCLGALLLDPGLTAFAATAAAVYLHGAAGDDLAAERGVRGLLAGEVADALPAALARRL